MTDITLSDGDDYYGYIRGNTDDTVFGLAGNDLLSVSSNFSVTSTVTLDGGAGDDTFNTDYNATIFVGGAGNDFVSLPLYNDTYLKITTDAQGRYVITNTYNNNQIYTIDPTVEQVQFANYYYGPDYASPPSTIAYADLPKFVGANTLRADIGNARTQNLIGTNIVDIAYFNGNVADYTYRQGPSFIDPLTGQTRAGTITLTAINGSGTYTISSSIEYVHLVNGQTLDFAALPGALAATPPAAVTDRTIAGDYGGSRIYLGGAGTDTLTLNGAIKDYVVKAVTAYAAVAPETGVAAGQAITGIALIATNGSGVYVIDPSIEQVRFSGGDGIVAYGALTTRVAAAPATTTTDTLHLPVAGAEYGVSVFGGDSFNDRALLNGFYGGTLSRNSSGDFILTPYSYYGAAPVVLSQSIETVQLYAGGPVLTLGELPRYISGNPTFTGTTAGNDILFNAARGDQYLIGGAGNDTAYLTGNVNDYAIAAVNQAATATTPAINGFELVSLNGSGNIFIDASTETVHMQNGSAFTTVDLPTFVTRHYAPGGVGTSQDDLFFQELAGNQRFVGAAGTDTVYLRGNPWDYQFTNVSTPAVGLTPATQGVLLHALNGSGDLYIDSTTEGAQFVSGLFASFAGLQSFG